MQSFYRQELRKFHAVLLSLPGSVSHLGSSSIIYSFFVLSHLFSLCLLLPLSLYLLFAFPLIFLVCVFNLLFVNYPLRNLTPSFHISQIFVVLLLCLSAVPRLTCLVLWDFYPPETFLLPLHLSRSPPPSLFSLALPSLLLSLPLFLPSVGSEQPSPRLLQSSFQDKNPALPLFSVEHTHTHTPFVDRINVLGVTGPGDRWRTVKMEQRRSLSRSRGRNIEMTRQAKTRMPHDITNGCGSTMFCA